MVEASQYFYKGEIYLAIQIIREVAADVVKRGATRAVYAKQNDVKSRFLNVRIQEEGKDIQVSSTSTVMLNVERPDHQENIFYGTVNEDGSVQVPLASWMLELAGTLQCDISIVEEGAESAKLTTMQFSIYVEEAVIVDASFIETEEYSVIVDLLKRTEEAEALASSSAKDAETLKVNCEEATAKANEAADKANAVRENVEAGGYIESLRELNKGGKFTVWVGTQAEYDALTEKPSNCFVLITDEKVPADYIVEQGETIVDGATWDYEKWVSGKLVCNGVVLCEVSQANLREWGTVYESPLFGGFEYPFSFVNIPIEHKSIVSSGGYSLWLGSAGLENTNTTSAQFCLCRASNINSDAIVPVKVAINVVGKWK